MLHNKIHYITKQDSSVLLNNVNNTKYKVLFLLMLDCGLRVSEACSIKFYAFDFKKRTLTIKSLKKRNKITYRTIPISDRLYRELAIYLEKYKLDYKNNSYLFPTNSKNGYINRRSVWRTLNAKSKSLQITDLHPHTLRHSFATHHLSEGTPLEEIKEMLGHSSYDTTLIYASIPLETLKKRIDTVTLKKSNFIQRIINYLIPITPSKLINLNFTQSYFTIGRINEIQTISNLTSKGINIILIGDIGTGKSHLLENIQTDKKILRLDDTSAIKKSLLQILLYLYKGDHSSVLNLIWQGFTLEEIKKNIQRENTIQVCSTLISCVEPKEYILIIDDITRITPGAKDVLEKLKDTFIIVCGARKIKAQDTSFLWNFEKIKIKNLDRSDSIKLIQQLSSDLQIENWEVYRNHVYNQTTGNPRAIHELIERYKKEPFITNEVVRDIRHAGALREFDFTFVVIIFFALITILRYASQELDEPGLRLIGSIGLILLILSRPMVRFFKRNFY